MNDGNLQRCCRVLRKEITEMLQRNKLLLKEESLNIKTSFQIPLNALNLFSDLVAN